MEVFLSHRIEDYDLSAFTQAVEESIGLGLNLVFSERAFNTVVGLVQGENNSAMTLFLRHKHFCVIVRNIFLRDQHEGTKTKIEIFLHGQSIADDLVQARA